MIIEETFFILFLPLINSKKDHLLMTLKVKKLSQQLAKRSKGTYSENCLIELFVDI
jgi:hypothetical protein